MTDSAADKPTSRPTTGKPFITRDEDLAEIGHIFMDHVEQFNSFLRGEDVNGKSFFANTFFPFIYAVHGSVVVQQNCDAAVEIMEKMIKNQREQNVTSCELKRIDFRTIGSTSVLVTTIVQYKRNNEVFKEDTQTHLYSKHGRAWMATNTCM